MPLSNQTQVGESDYILHAADLQAVYPISSRTTQRELCLLSMQVSGLGHEGSSPILEVDKTSLEIA